MYPSLGDAYVRTHRGLSHRDWAWDFTYHDSTSHIIPLAFSLLWSAWTLARLALWAGIVFSSLLRFWSEIIHLWMGGYKNLPHAYENWTWKILIAMSFAFTERAVAMGGRTRSFLPLFLSVFLNELHDADSPVSVSGALIRWLFDPLQIMILEGSGVMNLNPANNLLHQQPAWTDSYPTCNGKGPAVVGCWWHCPCLSSPGLTSFPT